MSKTTSRTSMRGLARSVVTGRRSMDSTASTALIDLETELPARWIPDQTRYSVDESPGYANPPSAMVTTSLDKVAEQSTGDEVKPPCEIRIFTPSSSPGLRVMASSKRRLTKIRGSKTDTSSSSSPSTQPSTKRTSSDTTTSTHGQLNARGFPRTGTPRMSPRSRKSSNSAAKTTGLKSPPGPSFKLFSSTGSLACVPLLAPQSSLPAASPLPKATKIATDGPKVESKKTAAADVLDHETSDLVSLCSTVAGGHESELHEALEDEAASVLARYSSDEAETAVETWSISVDIGDEVGRASPWEKLLDQREVSVAKTKQAKLSIAPAVATTGSLSSQGSSLSMTSPPHSADCWPSSSSSMAYSTSESRSSRATNTSPASVDSRTLPESEGDDTRHSVCPSLDVSQRPTEFEDGTVQSWASLLALRGEQSRDKRASLRRSYMQSRTDTTTLQADEPVNHDQSSLSTNSCGLMLGPRRLGLVEDFDAEDCDDKMIEEQYQQPLQSFLEVAEDGDSPALSATGFSGSGRPHRERVIPSLIPPSLAATRDFYKLCPPRRRRGNKSDLPPQWPAPRIPLPPVPEASKVVNCSACRGAETSRSRGRGFSDPTSSKQDRLDAEHTQGDPNDRSASGFANETEQPAEAPEVSGVGSSAASSITIRGRGSLGHDSSLESSTSPPLASKRLDRHKLARGPKPRSRSSGPASMSARSASRGRSKKRGELNLEAIDLLIPVGTKIRLMEGPVPLPSPSVAGDATSPGGAGIGLRRVFWPPPAPRASSGSSQRQELEGNVKTLDDATANRPKKRTSLLPSLQAVQGEGSTSGPASGRRRAATLMAHRIVANAEVKLEAEEQTVREQEEQIRLRRLIEYEFEEKEMEWKPGGLFRMR